MTAADGTNLAPFLLSGARGPLLAVYYPPSGPLSPAGDVLVAPAFAEEMNRCRAMVAMQARRLARIGIGTLIVDPYGTGDSGGEFADATWSLWRDDLARGVDWLRRFGNGCRTIWGVRLGAIMAGELAKTVPGIDQLVLWQPVAQGKAHVTQFLRIRVAAELEQSDGVKSTDELRRRAAAGERIEVSGYRVNPDLVSELDRLTMPEPSQIGPLRICWCEVVGSADAGLAATSTKSIDAYQTAGVAVSVERVVGPAFWQVHERVVAEELLDATTRVMSAWSSAAAASCLHTAPERSQTSEPVSDRAPPPIADGAEFPIAFACDHEELIGVVHRGKSGARRGIIGVVAGGPQYRAGAHRQFVSLARKLAACGYPVLRFDLRGMGDSSGVYRGFQESAPDIRAAIDLLLRQIPEIDEIVLFGECESASGILFYAFQDVRVKGIALVNPWVRTEEGRAGVIIKHYYLSRLSSADFWRKVRAGQFNPFHALASLITVVRSYLSGHASRLRSRATADEGDISALPLPEKTAAGLRRFRGQVLILMSGRDYIAREFDEAIRSAPAWAGLLDSPRVLRRDVLEADHTFSREVWKSQAADWVRDWLGSW